MSALSLTVRPNIARVTVVGIFAVLLVALGFLVPFWIVFGIGSGLALLVTVVRKWRKAALTVDQILADELRPND